MLLPSSTTSLTFTWASASSATKYRLFGDGVNQTTSTNMTEVDSLTFPVSTPLIPGTLYTVTVWAVGYQGLTSNIITCVDSTGTQSCKVSYALPVYDCAVTCFVLYRRLRQFYIFVS